MPALFTVQGTPSKSKLQQMLAINKGIISLFHTRCSHPLEAALVGLVDLRHLEIVLL